MPDGHAEEVLPTHGLQVGILEGLFRYHANRTTAGFDLFKKSVIPEASRHRMSIDVIPHHFLRVFVPGGFVLFAVCVLGVRLEVQEIRTDRAIAVLESGEDDPIFHLRHLGAGEERQRIGRRATPGGIPGTPHAFAHRAGFENVRCATGTDDNGFGAEDVVISCTDVEADSPGHPISLRLVHQQVSHHDPVVDLGGSFTGSFSDDGLIAFAVDHDLPFAFAQIPPGFRVLHHRKAPLFELVHRGVHVPRDVVAQIFAHQPHQVVARVADMVLGLVFVPLHAHVAVDRIQALRHRAAALDVGFLDADDLQVASPIPGFVGGPTARHATADDENIRIDKNRFPTREETH